MSPIFTIYVTPYMTVTIRVINCNDKESSVSPSVRIAQNEN